MGVEALIVSKYGHMHPAQLRAYLNAGADDLDAPGEDPVYGAGRVNALGSVSQQAHPKPATAPKTTHRKHNPPSGDLRYATHVIVHCQFGNDGRGDGRCSDMTICGCSASPRLLSARC